MMPPEIKIRSWKPVELRRVQVSFSAPKWLADRLREEHNYSSLIRDAIIEKHGWYPPRLEDLSCPWE